MIVSEKREKRKESNIFKKKGEPNKEPNKISLAWLIFSGVLSELTPSLSESTLFELFSRLVLTFWEKRIKNDLHLSKPTVYICKLSYLKWACPTDVF